MIKKFAQDVLPLGLWKRIDDLLGPLSSPIEPTNRTLALQGIYAFLPQSCVDFSIGKSFFPGQGPRYKNVFWDGYRMTACPGEMS